MGQCNRRQYSNGKRKTGNIRIAREKRNFLHKLTINLNPRYWIKVITSSAWIVFNAHNLLFFISSFYPYNTWLCKCVDKSDFFAMILLHLQDTREERGTFHRTTLFKRWDFWHMSRNSKRETCKKQTEHLLYLLEYVNYNSFFLISD